MDNEHWQEEYKHWKKLRPAQVRLLEEGAQSLSQSWLLNQMWCDWKEIKELKATNLKNASSIAQDLRNDLWED